MRAYRNVTPLANCQNSEIITVRTKLKNERANKANNSSRSYLCILWEWLILFRILHNVDTVFDNKHSIEFFALWQSSFHVFLEDIAAKACRRSSAKVCCRQEKCFAGKANGMWWVVTMLYSGEFACVMRSYLATAKVCMTLASGFASSNNRRYMLDKATS